MSSVKGLMIAATLALAPATPAAAQEVGDILHSSFALWGMMDAVGGHCWEVANFDITYMEALEGWRARNVFVRDELEAALAATGQSADVATAGEHAGATGIMEIMNAQPDQVAACALWLAAAQSERDYEAEFFLSEQLGIIRERDGL